MIPTPDNNHVAEAVALLTSRYMTAPVVSGLVKALSQRVQELETQYWSLLKGVDLANHPMPGGPWGILDQIGTIVVQPRLGLPDSAYLPLLKLKAAVNRSNGNPEDIIRIGKALDPNNFIYTETPPAAFNLCAFNLDPVFITVMGSLVAQARPAGVYALLTYTTWARGNDLLLSDAEGVVAGAGVLGDAEVPGSGSLLADCIGV